MAIRFPKMHIAESVVNRILNAHDELNASVEPAVPELREAPAPVDPTIEGAEIDLALMEPTPPVSAPEPQDTEQLLQQGILGNVVS